MKLLEIVSKCYTNSEEGGMNSGMICGHLGLIPFYRLLRIIPQSPEKKLQSDSFFSFLPHIGESKR